jgi:hypothetical protein
MNAVWPTALNCVTTSTPILLVALFVFVWFFLKMATAAEADRNSSVRRLPLRRPSFLSLFQHTASLILSSAFTATRNGAEDAHQP